MGQDIVVIISIVAGVFLGVFSNWLYDLARKRDLLPKNPSIKMLVVVLIASLPLVLLVALPSLLESSEEEKPEQIVTNVEGPYIGGSVEDSQIAGGDIIIEESKDTTVVDAQLVDSDPSKIVALNKAVESLWSYSVRGNISDFAVRDLDADGKNEILLGVTSRSEGDNNDVGKVIVLSDQGDVITEYDLYDPNKPTIFYGASGPRYWVNNVEVADLFGTGQLYVIATGHNGEWFSSRIVILSIEDGQLSLHSNYWHPGFPRHLVVNDLNGDQVLELVVSAANNSFPSPTGNPEGIFVLRSDAVSGQAPPYYGDAPKGSQLWYYLVEPSGIGIRDVDVEDRNNDERPEVKVGLSDSCFFYINYSGEIVARQYGSNCSGESKLVLLD